MLFKFPKKKIVLDCFTTDETILQTAPISHAIKYVPDWWKSLPQSYLTENGFTRSSTAKNCTGIIEYYKKSIVLPLWSDLAIRVNQNSECEWQFSDLKSTMQWHNTKKQAAGFLDNYVNLKLVSPWRFKTKESVQWVWSHPAYAFQNDNDVVSLPAVIDFKNQPATNINLMIRANLPQTIFINHGQPLAHLTPMSDRKVSIARHLVSEQEYEKIENLGNRITFLKAYANTIEKKKQFADCPYHKK